MPSLRKGAPYKRRGEYRAKVKNLIFFLVYFLFAFFIYILALPFLVFLLFKKKYRRSIPARFFLYKNPPFKQNSYWFHACSYGETKALKPVVEAFEKVNISVITDTGFEAAKEYENADVRFLPYEIFLPFWIKKCKTLVVMEAELWYMLFFIAKRRCNKTVLLNARISDKSFPKYIKFRWFYKKIFENIDMVLAQSETDRQRLMKLGAKNVKITGNIKTYFNPSVTREFVHTKPLLVVASTHEGEEKMILSRIDFEKYQVAVVPRHPQRFDEVYKIMKKFGDPVRFSEKCKDNAKCIMDDFMLIDKMGELVNLYASADAVILGGSFVDNVGGHNPIEAAFFNVPILSGKYYFNQKVLFDEVEGIEICTVSELEEKLKNLKHAKIRKKADIKKIIDLIQE